MYWKTYAREFLALASDQQGEDGPSQQNEAWQDYLQEALILTRNRAGQDQATGRGGQTDGVG